MEGKSTGIGSHVTQVEMELKALMWTTRSARLLGLRHRNYRKLKGKYIDGKREGTWLYYGDYYVDEKKCQSIYISSR